MSATDDLLFAFETHSPADLRAALQAGADSRALIKGKRPIDHLVEMYMRSSRFHECLLLMFEAGATLDDSMLEALLLDDELRLREMAADFGRTFHLPCAYTSLQGVSPLHVCAEYNSVKCARVLLEAGLPVDVRAAVDPEGMGGHTPLFHTVNANQNHCREMMELLVRAGADLDVRIRGVVWGEGFEWETLVFDTSPISYAQCGLFFQFHRREKDVYSNIAFLYRARYGSEPPVRNVPNKYLRGDSVFPPRT